MAILAIGVVGGFLAQSVGLSFGLGFAIFGSIAQILMAPKPKSPEFRAMTSAWGATWPLLYNNFRVAGQIIQASDVTEHSGKKGGKKGGGKSPPTYSQTFAVGFCEGQRAIGRIWADNKVIYDPRPIVDPPAWQANTDYGAGDVILPTTGGSVQFTATANGVSGPTEPSWNRTTNAVTHDGTMAWIASKYKRRTKVGKQSSFTMRIYTGTEAQLPDAALEELVGTGKQPAYRGLCYIVFENLDLSKYGNRIPSLEAEIIGAETWNTDAVLYGGAETSAQLFPPPFLADDAGNLYAVASASQTICNIKTLVSHTLSNARVLADAAALGFPGSVSTNWLPLAVGGKYFIEYAPYTGGPSGWGYAVMLYEINTDGSFTAIGCKTYQVPFSASNDIADPRAVGIHPDTSQIMVAYGGLTVENINVIAFDSIADLTGGWADRPSTGRTTHVSEITGSYAAVPQPYLGYCLSFVGSNLYVTLNKAHMDWLAAHSSGGGYNSFYKALQPAHPNGVQLKISIGSSGGALSHVYDGITTDFGWPFADEGLNRAGSAGHTSAATYDCWSIPVQAQGIDGSVDAVYFVRGYSDATNEVGFKQFRNDGAWSVVGEDDGVPFATSFAGTMGAPLMMPVNGPFYLTFHYPGLTNDYFAKLGYFTGPGLTLADICADVSGRVGLDSGNYDFSALESVAPKGAGMLQRDTARSFLEAMQPAFFYDLTDIGDQIVGSLRSGSAIALSIPEAHLAAAKDAVTIVDKINSTRGDDLEIPKDLSITFYDYNNDYQQGSQQARRNFVTQYSSGHNTSAVPVVMSAAEAANAAARSLYLLWAEREAKKLTVPLEYAAITPADVIEAVRGTRNHFLRVTKATLDPASLIIALEGVSEDLGVYSITVAPAIGGHGEQTIVPVGVPVLAIMDTAPLRFDDLQIVGIYAAGAVEDPDDTWDGEIVTESPDDSVFTNVATLTAAATMGVTVSSLGDCPRWTVFDDENTLDVQLNNGVLGNASEANVINNFANLAWLSTGEIFQFTTALLLPDGITWRLSHLLRGRFGTEQFIGMDSFTGGGDQFVMLDAATIMPVTYPVSDIGAVRYWQGLNDAPDGTGQTEVEALTMTTRRLMPFAPCFLRATRDPSANLTITGLRRMRWRGTPLWHPPETDTPVSVEIDIYDGTNVVRTLTSTLTVGGSGVSDAAAFTAAYSAADQVSDFGSAQSSLMIRAYARNALVGRGYGRTATL